MSCFLPEYDNDLALETSSVSGKKRLVLETDAVISGLIKLYHRFQFWEGEWYQDTREGMPYLRYVFVKNPDLAAVRKLMRHLLMSTGVIATVNVLEFTYVPSERKITFNFEAKAVDGRKVEGGSGKPFIVNGREIFYKAGTV